MVHIGFAFVNVETSKVLGAKIYAEVLQQVAAVIKKKSFDFF